MDRWMDKEDVVNIDSGILLSQEKDIMPRQQHGWTEVITLSEVSRTKISVTWCHLYAES